MTQSPHRQPLRLHWPLGALLIGMTLLTGCEQPSTSPIETGVPNTSAPTQAIDFSLPDLAGRPHTPVENLKRGPVMLVFFTTWCPYCQKEIPVLKRVYREYGANGLTIVAINVGLVDSLENAQAYALEHRLPYAVLYDVDGMVSGAYGVQAVPRIFLVQQDGTIARATMHVPQSELETLMRMHRQPTELSGKGKP